MSNIKSKVEMSFSNGGELTLYTEELLELESVLDEHEMYKEALDKIKVIMDSKGWDDEILGVFIQLESKINKA